MDLFLWIWFFGSLVAAYYVWKGINNLITKNETYEEWILEFGKDAKEVITEIDRLDHAGTFRGDDEVGYFFNAFKKIIDRMRDYEIVEEDDTFVYDTKRGILYGPQEEE